MCALLLPGLCFCTLLHFPLRLQPSAGGDDALRSVSQMGATAAAAARSCLMYRGAIPIVMEAPSGALVEGVLESVLEFVSSLGRQEVVLGCAVKGAPWAEARSARDGKRCFDPY